MGHSLFEVLYGFPPRHFGLELADAVLVLELHSWLEERALMHDLVRQHLLHAQARMKRQADKGSSEWEFSKGDLVFLKLQPYVQSSVCHSSNQKPSFKFLGHFASLLMWGLRLIGWTFRLHHTSTWCFTFLSSRDPQEVFR